MGKHDEAIRMDAGELPAGSSMRTLCPECDGGRTGEVSLSIARTESGALAYKCFRASCGLSGYVGDTHPNGVTREAKPTRLRPYMGELFDPDGRDYAYFSDRFGLRPDTLSNHIHVTEHGDYAIDIRSPWDSVRGYVIRRPTWTHAFVRPPRLGTASGPKALTYMHDDGPAQAWYTVPGLGGPTVLVEDQISALRVRQEGLDAVALLGTTMTAAKAGEIARHRPSEVIIALDSDATEEAFRLAARWAPAWQNCRVAILPRDPKDLPTGEIRHILAV